MNKVEKYSGNHILKCSFDLQIVEVKNGFYVFKLTKETRHIRSFDEGQDRSKMPEMTSNTGQGITNKENIDAFLNGECDDLFTSLEFLLVNDKWLELMRTEGWYAEGKYDYESKKPFDDFVNGGKTVLVHPLWDCHMVEDADGDLLPVGIYFEDISGRMNNANYDLEKAIKILKKRKDIACLTGIVDIESYNASKFKNKRISFIWQPTAKDYKKMWRHCLKIGEHPSILKHQAIFELDLLGLRKGKAALHDEFYKSR